MNKQQKTEHAITFLTSFHIYLFNFSQVTAYTLKTYMLADLSTHFLRADVIICQIQI